MIFSRLDVRVGELGKLFQHSGRYLRRVAITNLLITTMGLPYWFNRCWEELETAIWVNNYGWLILSSKVPQVQYLRGLFNKNKFRGPHRGKSHGAKSGV